MCEHMDGRALPCRDQALPLWGTQGWLCKPELWEVFGDGAVTALGLGGAWALGVFSVLILRAECVNWDCH